MRRIISLVLCFVLLSVICLTSIACNTQNNPQETTPEPNSSQQPLDQNARDYEQAFEWIKKGEYEAAYALFVKLGDYKDAKAQIANFRYVPTQNVIAFVDNGEEKSKVVTIFYGENGLPTHCTEVVNDGYTHTCTFTQNQFGQVISINCTDSEGNAESCDYIYDKNGNRVREFAVYDDGDIYIYRTYYNEDGMLTKQISQALGGFYYEEQSIYDENGRETQTIIITESETFTTVNSFDENGNRTKTVEYDLDGNEAGVSEYFYDENGNTVKITYVTPDGYSSFLESAFDENGRKTFEHYKDGEYTYTYRYTYDASGNCTQASYSNSSPYESESEIVYKLVYIPDEYSAWDSAEFIETIVDW